VELVGGNGLLLAFDLHLGQGAGVGAFRELRVGRFADYDAAGGGVRLEPGAEVDGVAEYAVDAVTAAADDPGQDGLPC
jgi:hypothetical protein